MRRRPDITVDLWTDEAGFKVLANLDANDRAEAEVALGRGPLPGITHFAEWRQATRGALCAWVIAERWSRSSTQPFAVLTVHPTIAAGVAEAAFLSLDHRLYRRPLAEAALRIRDGLGNFAHNAGLNRIEARCWAGHPAASGFLTSIGFAHETDLPGFGATGGETFRQFAWVRPGITPSHRQDKEL